MDVASRQTGTHAMQVSRFNRGNTRSGNPLAARVSGIGNPQMTRPSGAGYGDGKFKMGNYGDDRHGSYNKNGDDRHGSYNKKSCSYCDGDTHTVENCYYINGFPVGHKLHGKNIQPRNKRHTAYLADRDTIPAHHNNQHESPTFTTEEYNQLIALLRYQSGNISRSNTTDQIAVKRKGTACSRGQLYEKLFHADQMQNQCSKKTSVLP
ncbi:hypothetical protein DKX38_001447 [Salix brachista]|uniref:Uncharacterized protein n=1 Tax=Salix brachista TaxID=2182728 RepID=A0A5N5P5Q0_9ROSI|nr:hypothetical protein DKX38_001447 [Salix brachista]